MHGDVRPSAASKWSKRCLIGHLRGDVTEQLPEAERHLYPENYMYDSLNVRLGGRAGELLVLGQGSTGANDLPGATELATRMARDWGMSKRLGPIGSAPKGRTTSEVPPTDAGPSPMPPRR